MCPEVERSFDNMYSVKRGQTFDVLSPFPESVLQPSAPLPAHFQTEMLLTKQAVKREFGAA